MIQHLQQKNSTDRTYNDQTHSHRVVFRFRVDIKHTVLLMSINDSNHISPLQSYLMLKVKYAHMNDTSTIEPT